MTSHDRELQKAEIASRSPPVYSTGVILSMWQNTDPLNITSSARIAPHPPPVPHTRLKPVCHVTSFINHVAFHSVSRIQSPLLGTKTLSQGEFLCMSTLAHTHSLTHSTHFSKGPTFLFQVSRERLPVGAGKVTHEGPNISFTESSAYISNTTFIHL